MTATKATEDKIIRLLAENIGVDVEDVAVEDTFIDDLHMSAADLTDFITSLGGEGFDISPDDIEGLETVGDLIETVSLKEDIS